MTRIRWSVQLKLEHNIEQHVPGEFDDEEQETGGRESEKEREGGIKGRVRRRRIRTLGTFKANPPPSIADSTFSLLISLPQSSANTVILRPFPPSNCAT